MKLSSTRFLLKLLVFLLTFSAGVALWWNLYAALLPDSLVPPIRPLIPNIVITDKDKMEIIGLLLGEYKVVKYKSKQPQTVRPKLVYLSTNNLPAPAFRDLHQIGETEIILLLVARADKTKPLPTVEFSEFYVKEDTVSISLTTRFSGSGAGRHCEYKKIRDQWQKISEAFSASAG